MNERLTAPDDLRPALLGMLEELDLHRLEIVLLPAPESRHAVHYIRAVQCANPPWYRELCALFPRRRNRRRKPKFVDSSVKRGHVTNCIRRLLDGGSTSQLAHPLLAYARELLPHYACQCEEPEWIDEEMNEVFGPPPVAAATPVLASWGEGA